LNAVIWRWIADRQLDFCLCSYACSRPWVLITSYAIAIC
jgi:hypothetical protein